MNKNFLIKGMIDGIPIALGYLSVSFAFGIFCVNSGLTAGEAVLISMCCFTSAGQLAAVPIITGGGSLVELAISQIIINLRYSLMGISLSQKMGPDVTTGDRFRIAFFNSDEIFAVATGQPGKVSRWYMYGLEIVPWLGWSSGTLIGALMGNILPEMVTTSLGLAIYGMFVAIVMPEARKDPSVALCVVIAVVLSCLFAWIPALQAVPSGFTVIICAVIASAVMAYAAPIPEEVEE